MDLSRTTRRSGAPVRAGYAVLRRLQIDRRANEQTRIAASPSSQIHRMIATTSFLDGLCTVAP